MLHGFKRMGYFSVRCHGIGYFSVRYNGILRKELTSVLRYFMTATEKCLLIGRYSGTRLKTLQISYADLDVRQNSRKSSEYIIFPAYKVKHALLRIAVPYFWIRA